MEKTSVEVTNKTSYNDLESLAKEALVSLILTLRKEKKIGKEEIALSIAMVKESSIRRLNRKYRKKDETTDVLSFCYEKSREMISGEIVICPSFIEEYSKKEREDLKKNFKKNLVHGFLHIMGYEHSAEMFNLQEKLMASEYLK